MVFKTLFLFLYFCALGTQVVIIAAPANAHGDLLRAVAPFVDDGAAVGALFAQVTNSSTVTICCSMKYHRSVFLCAYPVLRWSAFHCVCSLSLVSTLFVSLLSCEGGTEDGQSYFVCRPLLWIMTEHALSVPFTVFQKMMAHAHKHTNAHTH